MQTGRPRHGAMSLEEILNGTNGAAGMPLAEVPEKPQRPGPDWSRDPDFPNAVARGAKLRKTLAPFVPRPLLDMLVLGRIMGTYPDPRHVGLPTYRDASPALKRDVPPGPASDTSEPYIAGFDAEKGYIRSPSSPENRAIEIPNPGAIFDDIPSAGRYIHPLADPISRSLNTEFHWGYYQDKKTGKFGYTDPVDAGAKGGAGVKIPLLSSGHPFAPEDVIARGLGHNHGDYSISNGKGGVQRSTRRLARVQDDFSKSQRPGYPSDMKTMQDGPDDWMYTLGTPEGKVWIWTKQGGKQPLK